MNEDSWDFPCTGCGACCVINIEDKSRSFPCPHLNKDNQCTIYVQRPHFCNTKMVYEQHWSKWMTKEQYFEKSRVACSKLQKVWDYSNWWDKLTPKERTARLKFQKAKKLFDFTSDNPFDILRKE